MKKGRDLPEEFRTAGIGFGVAGNVSLQGLEVIQVVQNLAHSVPLIAGKPTLVRAYFDRPTGGTLSVRGELKIETPAGTVLQTVPSINTVTVDPADNGNLRAKRESLDLSLNFLLPPDAVVTGQRRFSIKTVVEAGSGEAVSAINLNSVNVSFLRTPPLRVRLFLLRYSTGNPPVVHLPTALDRALVKSWLKRAYPVSEVLITEVTVNSNMTWAFTCNQVNAQLSAIRNQDISGGAIDRRTHYYGLVADGNGANFMRGCAAVPTTPNPAAVGSGPTGAANFGWDFDGSYGDWYTGHELGHTFGCPHPGSGCGETSDDPNFPYPNGQISDAGGTFVGLDIGDRSLGLPMAVLPGTQWHDVMTYCSNQWLSYYTYKAIRDRLVAEDALGSGTSGIGNVASLKAAEDMEVKMDSGNFINVIGIVNLTRRTGTIEYVNPVENVLVPETAGQSSVTIRELNSDDQVLRESPVQIKLDSCSDPDEDQMAIIDFVTPYNQEISSLQLLVNGEVVDDYSPGALTPPEINLSGRVSTDAAMKLSWEGANPDDNIKYNLQASTDEGVTWETLAVGKNTPSLTIDRENFKDASSVQVRVIATNGFTSSVIVQETINLEET